MIQRLVAAVDAGGAVRRCSPEVTYPGGVSVVCEQPGIGEHRPAAQPHDQRQTVGMPMHAVRHRVGSQLASLLAAVDADIVRVRRPVAPEHVVAAFTQRGRCVPGRAERAKRYWQTSQGLCRDIKGGALGCFSRGAGRLLAVLLVLAACPTVATAQEHRLKIPTFAASAASAADWASTYHALKYYKVREVNPLLRPFESSPASLVALGAVIDAGAFSAWNLTVGRRHPKVAAAGLWGMAVFRTYLAIHNLRNTRRAERR